MIKNNKAQLFQIIYVVLLVIGLISLSYLYKYLSTEVECSGLNPSCIEQKYCGVDFKCHDLPDLSKNTLQKEVNKVYQFFPGLIFIALAVIISHLILRGSA
jgi:hypothetical protein